MNARRLSLALASAVAVSAALSPSALATTFCVGAPAGCSGVAVAPANLEAGALAAPQLADGVPDQIVIAPGTYIESADGTWSVGPGTDALSIRGAGVGQTILGSAGTGNQVVFNLDGSGGHPVTLRDLTVAIPASFPDMGGYGAGLVAAGDIVERVSVTSANPRANGLSTAGATTLRDITVSSPSGTAVRVSSGSNTSIENATLSGNEGVESYPGATTTVRRASIDATGDSVGGAAAGLANESGSLTASDVLITLTGAPANQAAGITASASATDSTTSLSHLTIVKAGGTNTVGVSSSVNSGNPGQCLRHALELDSPRRRLPRLGQLGRRGRGAGHHGPSLEHAAARIQRRRCGQPDRGRPERRSAARVTGGRTTTGWRRDRPRSTAGNAAYTTQATDLGGLGRNQDGNEDGVAKPDQGAYERPDPTPPVAEPPSSPSSPGSPALPGAEPSVVAKKTCKVPKLKGLTKKRAQRRLRRAGCRLGKVRRPQRRLKRKLVVRRQSLKAGRVVAQGTKVKLRLGAKPEAARQVARKQHRQAGHAALELLELAMSTTTDS